MLSSEHNASESSLAGGIASFAAKPGANTGPVADPSAGGAQASHRSSNNRVDDQSNLEIAALRTVLENLTGEMSRQSANINDLRGQLAHIHSVGQPAASMPAVGSHGQEQQQLEQGAVNPSSVAYRIGAINSMAQELHEQVLGIAQVTFREVTDCMHRLGIAVTAVELKARASGFPDAALAAELQDLRTALTSLLEVLDGNRRSG